MITLRLIWFIIKKHLRRHKEQCMLLFGLSLTPCVKQKNLWYHKFALTVKLHNVCTVKLARHLITRLFYLQKRYKPDQSEDVKMVCFIIKRIKIICYLHRCWLAIKSERKNEKLSVCVRPCEWKSRCLVFQWTVLWKNFTWKTKSYQKMQTDMTGHLWPASVENGRDVTCQTQDG